MVYYNVQSFDKSYMHLCTYYYYYFLNCRKGMQNFKKNQFKVNFFLTWLYLWQLVVFLIWWVTYEFTAWLCDRSHMSSLPDCVHFRLTSMIVNLNLKVAFLSVIYVPLEKGMTVIPHIGSIDFRYNCSLGDLPLESNNMSLLAFGLLAYILPPQYQNHWKPTTIFDIQSMVYHCCFIAAQF